VLSVDSHVAKICQALTEVISSQIEFDRVADMPINNYWIITTLINSELPPMVIVSYFGRFVKMKYFSITFEESDYPNNQLSKKCMH
jgi:hypothetical protein